MQVIPVISKLFKKIILTSSELLQKKKKLSNNKNMLLETGLLLKMQSDCLPVGGAVRAGELVVSPVMAVI